MISPVRIARTDLGPFLVGLAALPAQAVLLRELLARGGGNEIALTLYLGVWLAGSAFGARFWEGRHAAPGSILIASGPLIAVGAVAVARLLPSAGSLPGEIPRPGMIALTGLLVLLPASFLTAGLFPIAARGSASAGAPGRAYTAEAIGALIGGVATTALFVARVPPLTILALVLAACIVCAIPRKVGVPAAAIVAALAFTGVSGRLDDVLFTRAWQAHHPGLRLVAHAATPTRTLALAEREGERWLFADDSPCEVLDDRFRDEGTAALLIAAAPRPPRDVLLVDFGASGVARALLEAGVARVACLMPDREDAALTRPNPGVEVILGDPRRSFRNVQADWDVIAVSAGEGTSVAANRIFTTEAFAAMAGRLSPHGIIVALAPGGDAASGPESRAWRASVASAIRRAFGSPPRAIDADRYVFAASRDAAPAGASLDPDSLVARFTRAGCVLATCPPVRFVAEYPRDRLQPPVPRGAPANADARPAAFAHAVARWMRLSGIPTPPRVALIAVAVALALVPFLARRGAASVLLATGATSMGLDLIVLMTFQARVGLLQSGLGALLGAFLGGTAVGAYLAGRARDGARSGGLAAICLAQALIAAAAALALPRLPAAALLYVALAFVLGMTCGFPFPLAARTLGTGRAWSADALGGIIGAFLVMLTIAAGFVVSGLVLAALPLLAGARLLATTRAPGSRAGISGTVRP